MLARAYNPAKRMSVRYCDTAVGVIVLKFTRKYVIAFREGVIIRYLPSRAKEQTNHITFTGPFEVSVDYEPIFCTGIDLPRQFSKRSESC